MAGIPLSEIPRGLWKAIGRPIADDFKRVEDQFPLAAQAVQLHPMVGIPWSALKYGSAVEDGNTEGAIKASLSSIPLAERSYGVGNTLANSLRTLNPTSNSLRGWMNSLGTRTGAGEQVAESAQAGYDQGKLYAR